MDVMTVGWTRALAALAVAFALGGCNLVVSEKPLFTQADAAGAPVLRPGAWVSPKGDCSFDETKPVADWPECANPVVIRPGEIFDPRKAESQGPYVLAAGDPRIVQAPIKPGGDVEPKGEDKTLFAYLGLKPRRFDGQGRIVEFESWFVQCGPPPPEPPKSTKKLPSPSQFVTRRPLPGLKVDPKSGTCVAVSQGPVRNAARSSRAWAEHVDVARWVRDGEK